MCDRYKFQSSGLYFTACFTFICSVQRSPHQWHPLWNGRALQEARLPDRWSWLLQGDPTLQVGHPCLCQLSLHQRSCRPCHHSTAGWVVFSMWDTSEIFCYCCLGENDSRYTSCNSDSESNNCFVILVLRIIASFYIVIQIYTVRYGTSQPSCWTVFILAFYIVLGCVDGKINSQFKQQDILCGIMVQYYVWLYV